MRRQNILAGMMLLASLAPVTARSAPADEPVYYVIHQRVHDEARFAAYVEAVTPAIGRLGGELVAAGAPSYTEDEIPHDRAVVFRYPSRAVLEAFLNSEEYAQIRKRRIGAADWLASIVPALPAASAESGQ